MACDVSPVAMFFCYTSNSINLSHSGTNISFLPEREVSATFRVPVEVGAIFVAISEFVVPVEVGFFLSHQCPCIMWPLVGGAVHAEMY